MNQRLLALNILKKTIKDESYANLLMRKELNKVPSINRPFITELVLGTLRNYDLLMYQIRNDINNKTNINLKHILILALYEKFFMNTKEYALVNEYVDLLNNKYEKSFINAILRKERTLEYADDSLEGQATNNSLPIWIMKLLSSQYNKEELSNILNVYKRKANTYYRLNPLKCSYDDLKEYKITKIDDRLFTSLIPLFDTNEFKRGYFYIQDINSSTLVDNLDLNENDIFLDMCSAPGSKLFNALEIIEEENAYANDLYEHRIELIKKASKRLGYSKINYLNIDGTKLKDNLDIKFNKILLDAPCSGLGVLSRKPDLKFHIRPESLDELERLQSELLENSYALLKKDGLLVYSTCTLNKKENNKQISKFIDKHNDLLLIKDETIIKEGGDCFYFAKIKKV